MVDAEKPDKSAIKPVKPLPERDAPSAAATGLVSGSLRHDPTFFEEIVEQQATDRARTASDTSPRPARSLSILSGGSDTAASSPLGEYHATATSAQVVGGINCKQLANTLAIPPPDHTTLLSDTSSTPSVDELASCPYGSADYEAGGHQLVNHAHTMPTSPSYAIYHENPTDQDHGSGSPSKVVVPTTTHKVPRL